MQAHCSVISEASTTPSNSLLSGSVLSTSIEKSYLCSLSEKCFLRIHFMLSVLFLCHSLIFSDSPSGNHFPDTCLFSAGRRLSAGSRATLHTQRPPAALETWIHKQVVMVFYGCFYGWGLVRDAIRWQNALQSKKSLLRMRKVWFCAGSEIFSLYNCRKCVHFSCCFYKDYEIVLLF